MIRYNPIYVAEAVIGSVKSSYARKTTSGAVKVVEGRSYESEKLDSLPVKICSGPHSIFYNDVVASRKYFLASPKSYSFEIVDTTRFEHQNVLRISFTNNDGRGTI
jgi:hypothetical protein